MRCVTVPRSAVDWAMREFLTRIRIKSGWKALLFVLDLVAEAFEGPEGGDVNPYVTDPLEDILLRVCRRENARQRLDIDPARQLALFEELFREKTGRITEVDLRLYLEATTRSTTRAFKSDFGATFCYAGARMFHLNFCRVTRSCGRI